MSAKLLPALSLSSLVIYLPFTHANELEEISVQASRVANTQAATSLSSIATTLSYDSQVELYSRGLAEGQSDITVRGSMFESTSVKIGAVVLMDPQTGHYTANLPISPEFLAFKGVLTGAQNAVEGFNATVATLRYDLAIDQAASRINVSAGTDKFNAQSALFSQDYRGGFSLGLAAERSEGDGTIDNGDHAFQRLNIGLTKATDDTKSSIILASQHTFFGWPGAYTGFASLPETDHTDTDLILINHQQNNANADFAVGAYYRRVVDNYDFDRRTLESGTAGSFEHETASWGIGLEGNTALSSTPLHYRLQWSGDDLVSSTDLTHGTFSNRQYLSGSIGIRQSQQLTGGRLTTDVGLSGDYSNRDSNVLQPYAYFEWLNNDNIATFVDYARTSQLPGYTALQSNTAGLFGGNPALSRERSEQLEVGVRRQFDRSHIEASIFWRNEMDVIDWTFSSQSPFARQANTLDNEVTGLQIQAHAQYPQFWLAGGITWLNKDFSYHAEGIDASYYALNYAKLRATLSAVATLTTKVSLRLDSEYRKQAVNALRTSAAEAFLGRLSVTWQAAPKHQFAVIIDNINDDDFQMYPGTPGTGRSASVSYEYAL